MRKIIKHLAASVLVPVTRWYLRKERTHSTAGVTVQVYPGVFHPGLFSSTRLLADVLNGVDLCDKTFLELVCGTGFLSITAAQRGAMVTASDLSATAVENAKQNARQNHVAIEVIQADLFDGIPPGKFDVIVINPPYYARNPANERELAWYCGENFEYFRRLFARLGGYMNPNSLVLMALSLGCDVETIHSIGTSNGFRFQLAKEKRVFFDGRDFVFRIHKPPVTGLSDGASSLS